MKAKKHIKRMRRKKGKLKKESHRTQRKAKYNF